MGLLIFEAQNPKIQIPRSPFVYLPFHVSIPKISFEVMSANIPFEIQAEIINRVLDVKPLIRFRSVSKQWKSLIDSSEFITHHSLNHTPSLNHLLVSYYVDSEYKFVSIVDNDSFPYHNSSPDVPLTLKLLTSVTMVGSSHGLVCFYGKLFDKNIIVVWNPSIRKSVDVVLPLRSTNVGFGVSSKTGDPKIVNIISTTPMDWKVEVFTLNTGFWRSISMNFHMNKNIKFKPNQVVLDGVIHWVVYEPGFGDMILSFDLTSEEFEQVDLPRSLAHGSLNILKRNDSLAVLNLDVYEYDIVFDVWMMVKDGDLKSSFAKLFEIHEEYDGSVYNHPIGFRKNGELIREKHNQARTLELYEPCTQHSTDLGFDAIFNSSFRVTSYTESLLLLNHSDYIIQG